MSETDPADTGADSPAMSGVNIADHLRKLLRALPIALVVAAIVGGVVWVVRDGSPRTYEASLTAQISQQSIGAVFNELTQPYIVLVTESRVLSDVVKNGLAPSEQDLRPRVSAMTGPAPSLLIIKAQAGSPEQAEKLVFAVQQSLDSVASQMRTEAIARSAADLETHRRAVEDTFTKRLSDDPLRPELSFDARDVAREMEFRQVLGMPRLTVVANPRSELVAPHPVQEGLFAALATLIIVAESVVLARGAIVRRGGLRRGGAKPDPAQASPTPDPKKPEPVESQPATPTPPARTDTATVPHVTGSPSVHYDPETTVLPRQWPVRAAPVPKSSGPREN
ncbi:hypothetical protein [Nocardia rosealba]|uniref:hypothetical protein n=1 Tax=Nocardia rosealba TaxID=2878563 RepID=UPI001CD98416|nr:hypothetical protein [Nocardia rosealba]MCA2207185.1 hypothetical protein [Nocardia rosealba]